MYPQEESSNATIDNELFQMYAHFQLCRVKKGVTNSSNAAEKRAMVQILEACQHINANTFHTLVNDLLRHSVQLESFSEGGIKALFNSNTSNPSILPSVNSPLISTPQMNSHAGKKRPHKDQERLRSPHHSIRDASHAATLYEANLDQQYSPGQSGSENSDNEGPSIITPNRKRARSATITDSRQVSSAPRGAKYTLSSSSKRDLTHMSARPEETKQELFKRMKRITDSFRIEYSINEEGKAPAKSSFQIHFIEKFSPQSINSQCQTNFVAYQIGQIIEREARIFSLKVQEENKRIYYAKGLGKKANTKLSEINKYCKSLARAVNEIGVYCLFMPEVLPPTFYRRTDEELFNKMVRRLNEKFPQFATIASIDENGNLFIADIEDIGEDADETMDRRDVGETVDKDVKNEATSKDTTEEEEAPVSKGTEEEEAASKSTQQEAANNDTEEEAGDREVGQNVDKEAGEAVDEDADEAMSDYTKQKIKPEIVERSAADKTPEVAQDVNGITPGWHTF